MPQQAMAAVLPHSPDHDLSRPRHPELRYTNHRRKKKITDPQVLTIAHSWKGIGQRAQEVTLDPGATTGTPARDQGPGSSLTGPDASHPLHGPGGHGRRFHDPENTRNDLGRQGDE
jgi:hypothetical protein